MLLKLLPKLFITLTLIPFLAGCATNSSSQAAKPPTTPEAARELLVTGKAPSTTLGNPNAPTQIAVFQDVNCGMCRKMWREVVNGALKDDIAAGRVAYRIVEFPLGLAPNSSAIAIATKCAGEQNRAQAFLDAVYSTKGEHGEKELTMLSKKAGLDIPKMNECMNSGRGKDAAKLDVAIGNALGVQGTPTFFINGEELQGNWTQSGTWDGIITR